MYSTKDLYDPFTPYAKYTAARIYNQADWVLHATWVLRIVYDTESQDWCRVGVIWNPMYWVLIVPVFLWMAVMEEGVLTMARRADWKKLFSTVSWCGFKLRDDGHWQYLPYSRAFNIETFRRTTD
jgi:hypothetical protein